MRSRSAVDRLVSNAIKFTPSGGAVTVRVGLESGRATVAVTDTGDGIPEEEAAQVFEAFYRGAGVRSKAIQGPGLGLAIAKGLVDAQAGTIVCESADTGGATFRIELLGAAQPLSDVTTGEPEIHDRG